MEYVGQVVNGIIALIFAVISWRVKRYLDSITEREAELQSALAAKEQELYNILAEDRKRIEEIRLANNRGTQALLRDRLLQGYHFFRKRGMVTYGEARNYENMYEAYHDLGGNGMVKKMYEEIKELHIKSGGGK